MMEVKMKKPRLLLVTSLLGIGLYAGCSEDASTTDVAQGPQSTPSLARHAGGHQDVTAHLKWGPAPPQFPPGARIAVLQGDPSVPGEVFALRLKMPPGYVIPPHWHPGDEAVTVIHGTFQAGLGDSMSDANWLPPMEGGGFFLAARNTNHFVRALTEVVVQVHGIGPAAITYVNPEDDPRNP
jgi:quercetin dioxygenase-like cupin family protein